MHSLLFVHLYSYYIQVHGNNPVLNQQAKERLNLERELAGDEEKAISELSEEDRQKRQDLITRW